MFGRTSGSRSGVFSSRRTTRRSRRTTGGPVLSTSHNSKRHGGLFGRFHRKDPDRVAGGYKAALSNPRTSRKGRRHAKEELVLMGRGNEAHGRHPSLLARIKNKLHIRSSPRRTSRFGRRH